MHVVRGKIRRSCEVTYRLALRYGILKNPKICSFCKSKKRVAGHHPDYAKPLQVIWLCQSCHALYHYRPNVKIKTFIFPDDGENKETWHRCKMEVTNHKTEETHQCTRRKGFGIKEMYCKQHAKMIAKESRLTLGKLAVALGLPVDEFMERD